MQRIACAGLILLLTVILWPVAPIAAQPESPSSSAAAEVNAVVDFTWIAAEDQLFRIAASISNPHGYTVEGVTTRWEAYDASGAIVGSRRTTHPPILAGMSLPYVGGAGSLNLTEMPASVAIFIENPGHRTSALPRLLRVTDIALSQEGTARRPREREYSVTAVVTTDSQPVERDDINFSILLRDGSGAIVGADFAGAEDVPDILQPETRFRIEEGFIHTSATATSAEVFGYVRPEVS